MFVLNQSLNIEIDLLRYIYCAMLIEKVGFHTVCKSDALFTFGLYSLFLTNYFTVVIYFEFQYELHLVFQF